jgi:two-component system, OmpR family, sensor kinase
MLVLFRSDRRDEALQIYGNSSRAAYNAASDTLGQLTDQSVASAQVASDRLALDYRHAYWLILLAIVIAALLVVAALVHISRSISAPLMALANRMRRLAGNDTDIDVPATERQDEIGAWPRASKAGRPSSWISF